MTAGVTLSFQDLLAELWGACDALADPARVLLLIDKTTTAYATLQWACHHWRASPSPSSERSKAASGERSKATSLAAAAAAVDTLLACGQEELSWQSTPLEPIYPNSTLTQILYFK